MGFFAELWDFIKRAAKTIYNIIKKIFTTVFNGVMFLVEFIISRLIQLKNSWVGQLFEGIKFIFELIDFLDDKGARIDADGYKRELLDMDLEQYGRHTYELVVE